MATKDIFNVDENIKTYINEENKEDLTEIAEAFKRGQFSHVTTKTKEFRDKHETSHKLEQTLLVLEATCHAQTGDNKQATEIIKNIYQDPSENSIDDLILYGNLAFMADYKLARRIMSDAVKQIEQEETFDNVDAAGAYIVLGEAEENLEKYVRAKKYYLKGLTYLQEVETKDRQMIMFLHFKLGALHALLNETDEAIDYLEKTIELATEDHNQEMKINSLVSIAKMYGSKDESKKAITYLKEAIPLLEDSTLAHKLVHAEAYTEMAYNYFDQSQLDEAVPYYEKAISLHLNLPNHSPRELGMIYMQYAYCIENQENPNNMLAGRNYEKAIEKLENTNDQELLENALADTIAFFERSDNTKKKRFYENKVVKLINERKAAGQ